MDEAFIVDWQTEVGGGWWAGFWHLGIFAGTCDVLRDQP